MKGLSEWDVPLAAEDLTLIVVYIICLIYEKIICLIYSIASFILLIRLKVTAWNGSADIICKLVQIILVTCFCTVQWLNMSKFRRNMLCPF